MPFISNDRNVMQSSHASDHGSMVHNTIGRYEPPSLHIAVKWEARLVTAVGRTYIGSDPNGALT